MYLVDEYYYIEYLNIIVLIMKWMGIDALFIRVLVYGVNGLRFMEYGNDIEKEEEVIRENRSLGIVWKQCCQSPWARQTQKSKE